MKVKSFILYCTKSIPLHMASKQAIDDLTFHYILQHNPILIKITYFALKMLQNHLNIIF